MFGGMIAILIAIWIYRTAIKAKTGNAFYWVVGSFVVFLTLQYLMSYFNLMIIDLTDTDIGAEYAASGELDIRTDSDAGIQSGTGGTIVGILFEIMPLAVPFFVVAVIRLKLMLKQPIVFMDLFGGIKEMFVSIGNSFKNVE